MTHSLAEIGQNIELAKQFLDAGNAVAIPTETVYGLAANALDPKAVTQIFEIKNRPSFDPLIVHSSSISEAEKYVTRISDRIYQLAEKFSPGPITFILPKKDIIPDLVTSGHPTVGIRIPNHPLTLELLRRLDFPLAAPSANPFGFTSPTKAEHVNEQLGDKLPYILDGGACQVGVESTIVEDTENGLKVLRFGGLSIEEIESTIGENIHTVQTSSSNPSAPGMLISHYNPGKKVILGNLDELIQENSSKKLGVLSFQQKYSDSVIIENTVLSPTGDLNEAARNIFQALRSFQKLDVDIVLAEEVPNTGIGRAINDRLKRAAAKG